MRPLRQYRSASKEQYLKFLKQNPELELTYKLYHEIITKWNASFANYLMDTGDRVKMSFGLGPLCVSKYKPKIKYYEYDGKIRPNLKIDWYQTKKENKIIYHLNTVTDGMKYYWCWSPKETYIKASQIWKFEMARVHSRQLVKYLKNPKDTRKDNFKQWVKEK